MSSILEVRLGHKFCVLNSAAAIIMAGSGEDLYNGSRRIYRLLGAASMPFPLPLQLVLKLVDFRLCLGTLNLLDTLGLLVPEGLVHWLISRPAIRASAIISRVLSREDTALLSAAILLSKEGKDFLSRGLSITSMSEEIKTIYEVARTVVDGTPDVHPGMVTWIID